MRIALIAPPFIEVPPIRYGGTELFIGNLANELQALGHDVTVYTNGDSKVRCRVKWLYPHAEWPLDDPMRPGLKNVDHTAWAMADAAEWADVIHLNDIVGVPFTRFVSTPTVLTIHHPHEPALSEQYARYPDVHYVAIAQWLAERAADAVGPRGAPRDRSGSLRLLGGQGRLRRVPRPHGAVPRGRTSRSWRRRRRASGSSWRARFSRCFTTIGSSRCFRSSTGDQIQFVGRSRSSQEERAPVAREALLFPIQWEEPFGLVMIEAMACGTPVLALPGGSVDEVVRDGVSGWICRNVDDMAARIDSPAIPSRHLSRVHARAFFARRAWPRIRVRLRERRERVHSSAYRIGPGSVRWRDTAARG